MKIFKQLALAAALAIVGAAAHATAETEFFVIDPATNDLGNIPGELDQLYDFSSATTYTTGDARVKGDTFTDYFLFNVQDAQVLDVGAIGTPSPYSTPKFTSGVSFSTIGVYAFNNLSSPYALTSSSVAASSFSGEVTLASGEYVLEVTGSILAKGGIYSGQLGLTPVAVPEPADAALLLAGMGVMGAVLRRRNKKA